jgi:hypothetical protein
MSQPPPPAPVLRNPSFLPMPTSHWAVSLGCSLPRSSSTTGAPWWRWWGRTASRSPATAGSACSCRRSRPTSRGCSRSTTSSTSASRGSPPTPRRCGSLGFSIGLVWAPRFGCGGWGVLGLGFGFDACCCVVLCAGISGWCSGTSCTS